MSTDAIPGQNPIISLSHPSNLFEKKFNNDYKKLFSW